jgi:HEAT repeat protein
LGSLKTAYAYACAVVWCRSGEKEAGWELVRALTAEDSDIREIASNALAETGARSMPLLETALMLKQITPEQAAPCLQQIAESLTPETVAEDISTAN